MTFKDGVHREIPCAELPEPEQQEIARRVAHLTGLSLGEAMVELHGERR